MVFEDCHKTNCKRLLFKFFLLQVIAFVLHFTAAAQDARLRFKHLTVDNGLSHTDATSVVQDAKGFIWIGTYSGLNRYDGYTTKVYYNNTEQNRTAYLNRISSMNVCANNKIWIGTEGGLAMFDPAVMQFQKVKGATAVEEKIIKEPVVKLICANQKLYLAGINNLYCLVFGNDGTLTKEAGSSPIPVSAVTDMRMDKQNNVWVAYNQGILLINKTGVAKKMIMPFNVAANAVAVKDDGTVFIGTNTDIWQLTTQQAASVFKMADKEVMFSRFHPAALHHFAIPVSFNAMLYDGDGNFWFSAPFGIKQFKYSSGEMIAYNANEYDHNSISTNSINHIFIDRSSCLWASSFGGGVNVADLHQKAFQLLQRLPNSNNTLSANYIRAILEDEDENLWIGTRNNGLNRYNTTAQTYQHFNSQNSNIESNNIRSLTKDKTGRLWIGTDIGISILHNNGSFENLQPSSSSSFSAGNYFTLATDVFGQVWAGAWNNGLSRIVYQSKNNYRVERFMTSAKGLLSNRVTFIYADDTRPEVLVGTDHGLNHLFLNSDGSVNRITAYHDNINQLSSEFVWPVLRSGDSVIWVGTLGGGLNKIQLYKNGSYTIKQIEDRSAKALKDVESMLMDERGNLWLAGKLLVMYNPTADEFVHYDVNDGLQGNSFKIGAACNGSNGKLFFGGTNGVTYFSPSTIISNKTQTEVAFTDLLVNGIATEKDGEANKFVQAIGYTSQLKLNASQNNFSVQFSAMHYANPERCLYRYRLNGYDKEWKYTDASNRFAAYSNLDYGSYTLQVQATNNDGLWSNETASLSLRIMPPWWKSTLAKLIYLLLFATIVYFVWKYQHAWFTLKRKLQLRELEERKQEELHQMKLQFFTNISHEFRTPLTLILGPAEKMLHQETPKEEQHNYLRLIYSNARRLLGLINELMDFRKAETDSMKLLVMEADLNRFVNSIGAEFKEMALERSIDYNILLNKQISSLYFDPKIAEKIIVNLLSNAFKYTERGSAIEVELLSSLQFHKPPFAYHLHIPSQQKIKDFVWIRVADTGIGITPNSIENIFDRYFRVNTLGREKHLGTGVGLALVKSLVELHKGELWVYSERNKGSEFIVGFPVHKESYSRLEIMDDKEHQIDFENLQYTIDWIESDFQKFSEHKQVAPANNKDEEERKRILVVEDNEEMRRFLKNSLSDKYEIIEATNGAEGFAKAIEWMPDLIVSDLMMPEMDGNELCRKVKNEISISHTPFILITAKASVETHIEGVESGADIYFPKPFSLRLLQATIHNLFESRAKIKARYNKDVFAETREIVTNQKDKEFLDELIAIIEQNMEDEELDVEMICRKIGMSRTKLYGKVKAVTGQPIGEFIRLLRLKTAAKILVSEDVAIQEVMYRVGIQSQSYFTKTFKKEFGKTPSAFVQDCSKKQNSKK